MAIPGDHDYDYSGCPGKYTNLCDTWHIDPDADQSTEINVDATKDYKFGPPRSDKRCGSDYDADCIEGECCSAHGWCGSTKAHCNCHQCYRFTSKALSLQGGGRAIWRYSVFTKFLDGNSVI